MIDLRPADLEIVKNILRQHVPDARVLVFGSRVTGKTKPYSDLDLAVDAGKPLGFSLLGDLKDAFSESDLAFRVDVVDFNDVDEKFRNVILAGCEILSFE